MFGSIKYTSSSQSYLPNSDVKVLFDISEDCNGEKYIECGTDDDGNFIDLEGLFIKNTNKEIKQEYISLMDYYQQLLRDGELDVD